MTRALFSVNDLLAEVVKFRYAPAFVRANIKRILNRPVWGGASKTPSKLGVLTEEISRLKSEIKERRAETAKLKNAVRACWKICRDGENGEEVTLIAIEALGTRAEGRNSRKKPKQGTDKGKDG